MELNGTDNYTLREFLSLLDSTQLVSPFSAVKYIPRVISIFFQKLAQRVAQEYRIQLKKILNLKKFPTNLKRRLNNWKNRPFINHTGYVNLLYWSAFVLYELMWLGIYGQFLSG